MRDGAAGALISSGAAPSVQAGVSLSVFFADKIQFIASYIHERACSPCATQTYKDVRT